MPEDLNHIGDPDLARGIEHREQPQARREHVHHSLAEEKQEATNYPLQKIQFFGDMASSKSAFAEGKVDIFVR